MLYAGPFRFCSCPQIQFILPQEEKTQQPAWLQSAVCEKATKRFHDLQEGTEASCGGGNQHHRLCCREQNPGPEGEQIFSKKKNNNKCWTYLMADKWLEPLPCCLYISCLWYWPYRVLFVLTVENDDQERAGKILWRGQKRKSHARSAVSRLVCQRQLRMYTSDTFYHERELLEQSHQGSVLFLLIISKYLLLL